MGRGEGGVPQLGDQEGPGLHPAGGRAVQLQGQRGERSGTPGGGVNILGLRGQAQQGHRGRGRLVGPGLRAGGSSQQNPARPGNPSQVDLEECQERNQHARPDLGTLLILETTELIDIAVIEEETINNIITANTFTFYNEHKVLLGEFGVIIYLGFMYL